MTKPLKILLCVLIALALVGVLVYAIYSYIHRYDPDNFIGLTAEQIIKRHGEFDGCHFWDSTETYRTGVYVIKQKRVGYLGTYPEEYFIIHFDENGIAYECEHEMGGQGG